MAAVRTIVLARQSAVQIESRRNRLLLYVTSLCLLGLLGWASVQLLNRTRAMRRRARFEHVVAAVSMRFVTARAADLDAAVADALQQMALCVGAERAYFVAAGLPDRVYQWCEPGLDFPPGWPEDALQLSRRDYPSFGGVTQVVRLRQLPHGADHDALAAAGLQGWACVTAKVADGSTVLLGFDAVTHPCRIMRDGELGLLRMALDSITNALGRRTLEQERMRLESQLQQARRLETVGALASGIAHNFNNIVGAILGYIEMADERDVPSRTRQEIRRAGERARELVEHILGFAGRRDARRTPVDMHAVICEAASLLRASLPATVQLSVRNAPIATNVSGVHAQLLQVVLNLCNNAGQAMDDVGTIELQADVEDVTAARSLSHGALLPGRYVRVSVGDRGKGIDAIALERIFEPFFTTRANGNGLGLATVREIVREHSGAIHVESTPSDGSRFEVWLPCIASPARPPVKEPMGPIFGHGETVLVLEASADRLMQGEELLAAVGYEPVGFTRPEDARAAYLASPERFDAALVGHLRPSDTVLAFTAMLRRISSDLPIVLAASPNEGFGAQALVSAGISEVVSWPIKAAEIARALQGHLSPPTRRRMQQSVESS